jgi:tetratricopeptide (TPR) repeat protein
MVGGPEMNRFLAGILVLAAVTATPLYAQAILVEYVEGIVEVDAGGDWVELFIGDTVSRDETVRIGGGGLIELRDADRTVLLSRPGTYEISSVVTGGGRTVQSGLGSLMTGRIRSLVSDDEPRDAVVAGVRASEAVERSAVTWAGGESVYELVEEGLAALDEGAFEDAYYAFYDAWEFAGSEDLAMVQFYLGYSAYLTGSPGEALGYLREPAPDPATEFYGDHALTLAQIYVESLDYEAALELLDRYVSEGNPGDGDLQTALVLQGLAHDGSGDARLARERLEEARRVDPDSEAGALAAVLIESM